MSELQDKEWKNFPVGKRGENGDKLCRRQSETLGK